MRDFQPYQPAYLCGESFSGDAGDLYCARIFSRLVSSLVCLGSSATGGLGCRTGVFTPSGGGGGGGTPSIGFDGGASVLVGAGFSGGLGGGFCGGVCGGGSMFTPGGGGGGASSVPEGGGVVGAGFTPGGGGGGGGRTSAVAVEFAPSTAAKTNQQENRLSSN